MLGPVCRWVITQLIKRFPALDARSQLRQENDRADGEAVALLTPYSEEDDDREVATDLFAKLTSDVSRDQKIFPKERILAAARQKFEADSAGMALIDAIFAAIQVPEPSTGTETMHQSDTISSEEFFIAFGKVSRVRGERLVWVRTLGIDGAIAQLLKRGDALDGLRGLRELGPAEEEVHIQEVCSRFSKALPELLRRGLCKLREEAAAASRPQPVSEPNSKFAATDYEVGHFATLSEFYRGPEALFGVPNPKVDEGIEREHLSRANAEQLFNSTNYDVQTCPRAEWNLVVCPEKSSTSPRAQLRREVVGVDELMAREEVREEV